MPADSLAVALLAAGRSTRFGAADKLMATLGNRPLIAWSAQAGRSIGGAHRLLVAGPDAPFDVAAPGYRLLVNPDPAEGLSSSLRIAASAAQQAGATALLVLLADMPFVTQAHLTALVAAHMAAQRVVFSTNGGTAQPPALFPAASFDALQTLDGDKGARGLARDALLIEGDDDMLFDIDTPDDLARAQAIAARR